MCEPL
jgi:hypothetical protein